MTRCRLPSRRFSPRSARAGRPIRWTRRSRGGAFRFAPIERWAGQLHWGRLPHSRVLGVLANPAYAGSHVFGRLHSTPVVHPDGTVCTTIVQLPREEWPVVIHDHHPGYITWEDYLTNQARVVANLTKAGARPPREGHALRQKIIARGSCGRPMGTRYHWN
jgi:hypothetical protein